MMPMVTRYSNFKLVACTFALLVGFTFTLVVVQRLGAHAAPLGVFAHNGGYGGASLIVNKDGHACLNASMIGIVGDWTYDKNAAILTFSYFDPMSGKDEDFKFKFDSAQRSYSLIYTNSQNRSDSQNSLVFVTNAIPMELVGAFSKYPETVKRARLQFLAQQETKRHNTEKMAREEPEHQRFLQSIRKHPETVLTDEKFFSRENTPATRAFRETLSDKSIHFSEKTLADLLDKLPADNHWNREQIFARPELSSATIEKFYSKALMWGAQLNYKILANIATHSNTPRHLVEDIATRADLPSGATEPAQRQMTKLLLID